MTWLKKMIAASVVLAMQFLIPGAWAYDRPQDSSVVYSGDVKAYVDPCG